ncbi:unnamed protein product [Amaranthus hypochondriacus]
MKLSRSSKMNVAGAKFMMGCNRIVDDNGYKAFYQKGSNEHVYVKFIARRVVQQGRQNLQMVLHLHFLWSSVNYLKTSLFNVPNIASI